MPMFTFTLEGVTEKGKRKKYRGLRARGRDHYEAMDSLKRRLGHKFERLSYPVFRVTKEPKRVQRDVSIAILDTAMKSLKH